MEYKKFAIWEEPFITEENVDKFKLIAEGRETLVDKKHSIIKH